VTESEALEWLQREFCVSRETLARITAFVDLLREEGERQNLISKATYEHILARHVVDSAQLVRHAPPGAASWIDLGTGAGFPGLIISALHPARVTCVESRRLRVDWLGRAASALGIEAKTEIVCDRAERLPDRKYDVITARAFAPLDRLLDVAERFAAPTTRWVLPKGRNAQVELEAVRASWQGEFRPEPSLTDPDASIIVAEGVRRRGKGKS
jgi:16S rRNA (guanine527-N7)-methyltransferase